MKYEINYGKGVVVLPEAVLERLKDTGELELKVLIALISDTDISTLGYDEAKMETAIAYWRGTGILSGGKSEKSRKVARHATTPTYTGEELSRIIDENGLAMIIDECQRITGKVFTITEVNRIAALNSYLGLEGEFILLLFTYCAEKGKLTLKYIEKTAYDLWDNGIDTTEKLEDYIRREEEKHALEAKLRSLFGFGDRALTPAEKKHFASWSEEYGYGIDIITEAYNITVEKTGKLSLPYLSKILSNWYGKGLMTLCDVQASLMEYAKSKEDTSKSNSSFDIDEFFELALKRSKDNIFND